MAPSTTMRAASKALRQAHGILRSPFAFNACRYASGKSQSIKERFAEIYPRELEKVKALRAAKGNSVLGEVTLDMV